MEIDFAEMQKFQETSNAYLEYMGFPEWLNIKKCFFLFLHEIEASSCILLNSQSI